MGSGRGRREAVYFEQRVDPRGDPSEPRTIPVPEKYMRTQSRVWGLGVDRGRLEAVYLEKCVAPRGGQKSHARFQSQTSIYTPSLKLGV